MDQVMFNKNVDIVFSTKSSFLNNSDRVRLIVKRLEGQLKQVNQKASTVQPNSSSKPKDLNRTTQRSKQDNLDHLVNRKV
jgi:hypothetical protein